MAVIADIASIGTALFAIFFAVWITLQLLKKSD